MSDRSARQNRSPFTVTPPTKERSDSNHPVDGSDAVSLVRTELI